MDLSGIDEVLVVLLLQSDVVAVVQILCIAPPALRVGAVAFFDCLGLYLISQKVSMKSFGKSEIPHKFANLSFTITYIKNALTDLCGN